MTRVLVVADSFAPGFRGGGTRHLINAVSRLNRQFEFHVLSRDHDTESVVRFPPPLNTWVAREGVHVFHGSRRRVGLWGMARRVREIEPDVVLTNSVFSRLSLRMVALRWLGVIPSIPIVVAPEGEFHAGALRQKPRRKTAYRMLARALGLYRDVVWRATSEDEARDIRSWAGPACRVEVAPVVIAPVTSDGPPVPAPKTSGAARLIYLSRITPKKNLRFLIDVLAGVPGELHLDIVGPIGDARYWAACQRAMAQLPPSVVARYHGEAAPAEVPGWLQSAHALALPTLGENFGFVILESLGAGRPVLVAAETPWRSLATRKAGWDLPVSAPDAWVTAVTRLIDMDQATWTEWSAGAWQVAKAFEAEDASSARLAGVLRDAAEEKRSESHD